MSPVSDWLSPMGERRFRFAPTPSRPIHIGSAWAALVGWSLARAARGQFVLRIEDIDRTRSQRHFETQLLEDLAWLGIDWDEGPDVGGPAGPYRQSERLDRYDQALRTLADQNRIYACVCSRADIRQAQSAPHLGLGDTERPYPGTCRPTPSGRGHRLLPDRGGMRLELPTQTLVSFDDVFAGPITEDLSTTCGDVLLGRPGQPTYQLAVVVDDLAMGITDIVRGRDLLGSTARQLALRQALDTPSRPTIAHHGLIVDRLGHKLSKRDEAAPLGDLRAQGGPEALIAALGRAAGLFAPNIDLASANDLREAIAASPARLVHDLAATPHGSEAAPAKIIDVLGGDQCR